MKQLDSAKRELEEVSQHRGVAASRVERLYHERAEHQKQLIELDAPGNIYAKALEEALQGPTNEKRHGLVRQLVARDTPTGAGEADALNEALIDAATAGLDALVTVFLDSGADVNWTGSTRRTVLTTAVHHVRPATAALLLDNGAAIDQVDGIGDTALTAAVRAPANDGKAALVRMLLRRGASVDLPDQSGCSPLVSVIEHGSLEDVKVLLEFNPNVRLSGSKGMTPIRIAMAAKGRHAGPVVRLLAESGRLSKWELRQLSAEWITMTSTGKILRILYSIIYTLLSILVGWSVIWLVFEAIEKRYPSPTPKGALAAIVLIFGGIPAVISFATFWWQLYALFP